MSIQDLLNHHKQELLSLKAQIHDAEKRIVELGGIIAALEKAKEIFNQSNKGVDNGPN